MSPVKKRHRPVEIPMMRWTVHMSERERARAMAWCHRYGVPKPGDVVSVEFYQEIPGKDQQITAYIRRYRRDESGNLYVDPGTNRTAEMPVQEIPLSRFTYGKLLEEWEGSTGVQWV